LIITLMIQVGTKVAKCKSRIPFINLFHFIDHSPPVDASIPASPADAIADNTASEKPSDTDASASTSPVPVIASPTIELPEPTTPKVTDTKMTKKRSRSEGDTNSKSKKKRTNNNDDSGTSVGSVEESTPDEEPDIKAEKEKPAAPTRAPLDDLDPFDYPFDTTPIQAPIKNNKKATPAPKTKPTPASISSKPSRAAKSKVKYVEIVSDDDDGDDGDAYQDEHDDDSD
jgi:hypothetical protein